MNVKETFQYILRIHMPQCPAQFCSTTWSTNKRVPHIRIEVQTRNFKQSALPLIRKLPSSSISPSQTPRKTLRLGGWSQHAAMKLSKLGKGSLCKGWERPHKKPVEIRDVILENLILLLNLLLWRINHQSAIKLEENKPLGKRFWTV